MPRRVIVTGGSGKAGKYVIEFLVEKGHAVLNLDVAANNALPCRTLIADIKDSGQLFSAFSSYLGAVDGDDNQSFEPKRVDAVVHLAAIPRMFAVADPEVMKVNVLGTYNVLDCAQKLGIPKVILASSEAAYGFAYSQQVKSPSYFPVDEEHALAPTDVYGLSKLLNEETARAMTGRGPTDIYAIRIGDVVVPDDYQNFPDWFLRPESRKRIFWSYIDARDLGQIVHLGVEKDGLGFQIFNATNDHTSSNISNQELIARYFPNVPMKYDTGPFETLLSNRKIREVLNFREHHNWRRYVSKI